MPCRYVPYKNMPQIIHFYVVFTNLKQTGIKKKPKKGAAVALVQLIY